MSLVVGERKIPVMILWNEMTLQHLKILVMYSEK